MIHQSGASIVDWARNRIPPSYEILRLYAAIMFLIYGWTSVAFMWKLPSWLYFLNAWEITLVAAYILISNLLESLMVLGLFLFLSLVLPQRWLRNDLAVRGSILMYVLTFWACVFTLNSLIGIPTRWEVFLIAIGFLASVGLSIFLVKRNAVVRYLLRALSNRLIIFLYVWIPLSLLGLAVVIVRLVVQGLGAL